LNRIHFLHKVSLTGPLRRVTLLMVAAAASASLLVPVAKAAIETLVVDVPAVTVVTPATGFAVPDLVCPTAGRKPSTPRDAAGEPEPQEIPDSSDVDSALGEMGPGSLAPSPARSGAPVRLGQAKPGQPFRVAIWGDSHFAAAFFTDELARLLRVPASQIRPEFLPAGLGRPGIRLPVRKSCFSIGWRYEHAYASMTAAAVPGPGLVNLVAGVDGAWLAVDLRDPNGAPELKTVDIQYQQTAQPITVAVSVDGGVEEVVVLNGFEGPGQLQVRTTAAMSTLRLRIVTGSFTLHGFRLYPPTTPAASIDLFGFPGATVAGLQRANLAYLGNWFYGHPYDLVMLEFGTNEGNVPVFDPGRYRQMLTESVDNLQKMFPTSACLLVGPGDRGVLVAAHVARAKHRPATARRGIDYFRFSKIHAEITSIQEAVATEHGCSFWSMQRAMGGIGSAYGWARQNPALMARDLTHFTPAGYRELADRFAHDMGWAPEWLLADGVPYSPKRTSASEADARRDRRRIDRP